MKFVTDACAFFINNLVLSMMTGFALRRAAFFKKIKGNFIKANSFVADHLGRAASSECLKLTLSCVKCCLHQPVSQHFAKTAAAIKKRLLQKANKGSKPQAEKLKKHPLHKEVVR